MQHAKSLRPAVREPGDLSMLPVRPAPERRPVVQLVVPGAPAAAAPPPVAVPPSWKPVSLRLEYQLGEMPVLRLPLRALTISGGSLDGEVPAGDGPRPPDDLRSGKKDAALVSSLPIADKLPRLSLHQGLIRYVPAQYRRYYVDLQKGSFDDYLAGFSSKTRSTLRRKIRKLAEVGAMECREYRTPGQIDDFLVLARPLSERTYQERLMGKGLPVSEEFEQEMQRLARAGQLRAYLLTVDGRPAAFILCPIHDGVVQYEWVGYEPDLATLSPGTVLQCLALEKLFAEGTHRLFDFTEGEGSHKEFWARSFAQCADVYYFRSTARNALMVGGHAALRSLSRTAVTVLGRLGIKDRIKNGLRAIR
jgi:hypothetical protein